MFTNCSVIINYGRTVVRTDNRTLGTFCRRDVRMGAQAKTVLVTGANGKTGKLIASKVKANPEYCLRALCRTDESKNKLVSELKLDESDVVVADVVNSDLSQAAAGCEAMIIATSATPKLQWTSMPGFFWKRFVQKQQVMPGFSYPQMPEQVDWEGQKKQIDAAVAAGIKHVVLVSSMGGTQPENRLNDIGGGKILFWKRKAEQYLIDSGLTYTIVHPGGLRDGEGGKSAVVLDVDDKLLKREKRSIYRADVAELCVQALGIEAAKNKSLDCINDDAIPQAPVSKEDFESLFAGLQGSCDYSINPST